MGGLLHLVQRGGAWAGCGAAQSPHRCTKCNSLPNSGQCTNFIFFILPVPIKGLSTRYALVASAGPSVVCRPSRGNISRKLTKIDPQLLWNIVSKSALSILMPHSDPPLDDRLGLGNRRFSKKHGCRPAFYRSRDIFLF